MDKIDSSEEPRFKGNYKWERSYDQWSKHAPDETITLTEIQKWFRHANIQKKYKLNEQNYNTYFKGVHSLYFKKPEFDRFLRNFSIEWSLPMNDLVEDLANAEGQQTESVEVGPQLVSVPCPPDKENVEMTIVTGRKRDISETTTDKERDSNKEGFWKKSDSDYESTKGRRRAFWKECFSDRAHSDAITPKEIHAWFLGVDIFTKFAVAERDLYNFLKKEKKKKYTDEEFDSLLLKLAEHFKLDFHDLVQALVVTAEEKSPNPNVILSKKFSFYESLHAIRLEASKSVVQVVQLVGRLEDKTLDTTTNPPILLDNDGQDEKVVEVDAATGAIKRSTNKEEQHKPKETKKK